jgi:hypothetical protein
MSDNTATSAAAQTLSQVLPIYKAIITQLTTAPQDPIVVENGCITPQCFLRYRCPVHCIDISVPLGDAGEP